MATVLCEIREVNKNSKMGRLYFFKYGVVQKSIAHFVSVVYLVTCDTDKNYVCTKHERNAKNSL